jgi:PAS domain S-box-containing protein
VSGAASPPHRLRPWNEWRNSAFAVRVTARAGDRFMNKALHAFADAPVTANLLKHWYALIEQIPIGVYICDRDGAVTRCNSRAAALWGLAPHDQRARYCGVPRVYDSAGNRLPPEETPSGTALRTGRSEHDREILIDRADGKRIALLANAEPLLDEDGEIIGVVTCIQDITAQKQAEARAAQGRYLLEAIIETTPECIKLVAADGALLQMNAAGCEMLGASPVDVVGRSIFDVVAPDHRARWRDNHRRICLGERRTPRIGEDKWCVTWKLFKPDGTPMPHDECPMAIALRENRAVRGEEAVAERPDGSRVPIIPYPTPIRDASGRLVGAINMLVDISERKQAEYRQRILLDELNHRVKNNLQMLHSLLRTAQRETENREAHAVQEDAAHRVGAIAAAQRVLYSAESTTGFDTGEFLQAVCQSAQQAFAGDVKIKVQANSGELSNEVSMPLALILNELLTNAVKHGLKGRRHGTIRVALTREAERYRLTVEDDGDGFELKPASRRSSGLGLVHGLTRQIGGTFSVERTTGARCVVSFAEHRASLH